MEADSTTKEKNSKESINDLPFSVSPLTFDLYKTFVTDFGSLIVHNLQSFGLLHKSVKCPTSNPECRVVCKSARVVDRVQWVCESCGIRQPIRIGSFFFKLQCSLVQAVQIILAWCHDADCIVAAEYFGIKPRVATLIYNRLEDLAIQEQNKIKLGGENSVVLTELYPDCVNNLSPDTTDQPHMHRILMLADSNNIPTSYWLHVIHEDSKNCTGDPQENPVIRFEIENVLSCVTLPNSIVVMGNNMPLVEGTTSIQQLAQHYDDDMHHFLTSRIWRQALLLCSASRDLCKKTSANACAHSLQRYLLTSLFRIRHSENLFLLMLRIIAAECTKEVLH